MKTFVISYRGKALGAIDAAGAADALKQFTKENKLGEVITPLRNENPRRVFTHNGQSDYIANVWSGEVIGHGRFYVMD